MDNLLDLLMRLASCYFRLVFCACGITCCVWVLLLAGGQAWAIAVSILDGDAVGNDHDTTVYSNTVQHYSLCQAPGVCCTSPGADDMGSDNLHSVGYRHRQCAARCQLANAKLRSYFEAIWCRHIFRFSTETRIRANALNKNRRTEYKTGVAARCPQHTWIDPVYRIPCHRRYTWRRIIVPGLHSLFYSCYIVESN